MSGLSDGKIARQWLRVRNAYLKANPPNHQGYYVCSYCGRWIPANEVTVDHIIARSKAPQLRFKHSNLTVACGVCNAEKGSKTYDVKELLSVADEPDEIDNLWGSY